jgi:hypothetical protein
LRRCPPATTSTPLQRSKRSLHGCEALLLCETVCCYSYEAFGTMDVWTLLMWVFFVLLSWLTLFEDSSACVWFLIFSVQAFLFLFSSSTDIVPPKRVALLFQTGTSAELMCVLFVYLLDALGHV